MSSRVHFSYDPFTLSVLFCLNISGDLVTTLQAKELTMDHHPDRDDEKARIEAAGGVVLVVGVPRVNGILAVSRSIGDIRLKRSFFNSLTCSRVFEFYKHKVASRGHLF